MHGIDRMAGQELVLFTITHPERYEGLDAYRSTKQEFRELVRSLLPDGWMLGENRGLWSSVRPPADGTPDAGFKIHVSSKHEDAKALLSAVVPILVDEVVAFKHVVDPDLLDLQNSSLMPGSSCGKFITIYPRDRDQLARLMRRLHEATRSVEGPYILSDRRYEGSKVLFYRYGAFKSAYHVNVYGEAQPTLRCPDGRTVEDARLPYFALPEGIDDPFQEPAEEPAEPILKGRFKALGAMGSSSKGGVYRCLDLATGAEVVVKEARPLVNRVVRSRRDAVDCLRNEYRILKRLEATGVTPRVVDFFQEWEHSFLVTELAAGVPLSSYRATESFAILLQADPSADDLRRFCGELLAIARKIVAGVRAIHGCGVVIQDLAPQNILFDPSSGQVTLVDFESAYCDREASESPTLPVRTPGFAADPGAEPRVLTAQDDRRAVTRILGDLVCPVTTFFALAPHRRKPLLDHVAREKGIPAPFVRLIMDGGEPAQDIDALLDEAGRSVDGMVAPGPLLPLRTAGELREIVARIAGYVVGEIDRAGDPLDLPADYRRCLTNKLSVAYGAAGIALFLHRATGEVPDSLLARLVEEASTMDDRRHPPGLYIGMSGVAWTLLELGRREEAEKLMDVAAASPLLRDNADMFYGASGWGLANLFFFDRLGDERYLHHAAEAALAVESKLSEAAEGRYYVNMGDVYSGLAHGAAGIAYFMLKLHQVTGQEQPLSCARALMDYEVASAEHREASVLCRRSAQDPTVYPYWRIGSAGVGSVALRMHAALKDERYADLARKIAHGLRQRYCVYPSNLSGMAGLGNFFVDMHRFTGADEHLNEARRFVDRIMLFALERPAGIAFPGEGLMRTSTDYGTGSSGIGAFIHRIFTGSGIPYFDF